MTYWFLFFFWLPQIFAQEVEYFDDVDIRMF